MWNLKACIVCFSTDVKLFSLNEGTLRKDFNLVSGLKIVYGNGMPEYLCVECKAYVDKCKKFRHRCHRAHHTLEQILIQNKEIKKTNLEQIDRSKIDIMPTLSYVRWDRINYSEIQCDILNSRCDGRSKLCNVPLVQCSTDSQDDTLKIERNDADNLERQIKVEIEHDNSRTQDVNWINNESLMPITNADNKSSLLMDFNDDFHDNYIDDDDETDTEVTFESVSCQLNNKVDKVRYSAECGDVVPMSVKEAKAAVEVYKYTSTGPYRCHCGKAFLMEKNLITHSRRHDLHISGKYHCEICDYYFKTAFLLQCHMSDQHMYKYLCKLCPEVSFTKVSAKQHYMSHVKDDDEDDEIKIKEKPVKKPVKKPSWITPTVRGGARVKGVYQEKPKRVKKKIPKDFPMCSPQTPQEQYQMVQQRRESRNYLEAKFKCELCYRGYRLTSTYNKHMAKHDSSKSGSHQCDMCKHYFRDTRRLYKHMIMYHVYKYSCQACDFVTTNKGQAIYHYRWHKNVTYDCPHCDKKFSKITTQLTHIRFKHPGTDICSICGHSFISSSGVKCHKMIAHSKEEIELSESMESNPDTSSPFHCAECRMQFVTEQAYATHLGSSKKHVEINVSSQSVMKCKSRASRAEPGAAGGEAADERPRPRRASSQVLNTGVTTPSRCNVCGVFLGSDVVARRHYESEHPGTDYLKRYMCDVCGHTTKQFANLLVHMRTHTREKPYPCPHCDRRFSMTSNRDRHLVVHTGEKRFQCQHCSRRFTQSTAVKLHIQTVHMKIPYKPWDKKNRKRRKEAQQNAQGTEIVPAPEEVAAPQHKLIIDPQGELITYIYTHEQ